MASDDIALEDNVEIVPRDELIPYTNNPKEHPEKQVKRIASSIKNYGWDVPIVLDSDDEIIKGHGRYQAAGLLGLEEVPVIRRADLTDGEAKAARIADNKTAESPWDEDILGAELDVLTDLPDIDETQLGFDADEIDDILNSLDDSESQVEYTDKVATPTYEPTQDEPPAISECYDTEHYETLLAAINNTSIAGEFKEFLRFAAQRHIVFDYENIAEYFAHQDQETQELMELLTLVIVDYDKALEQGFIKYVDKTMEEIENA
jgi:hypothetical protein